VYAYALSFKVIHEQTCAAIIVVDCKPKNYLVFSVINLLCCSICFGLPALIYSLEVSSHKNTPKDLCNQEHMISTRSLHKHFMLIKVNTITAYILSVCTHTITNNSLNFCYILHYEG